jgi:hypothetical protein
MSSTYPILSQFACFGTDRSSLTYTMNKTGPSMDPWGTPTVRGTESDNLISSVEPSQSRRRHA